MQINVNNKLFKLSQDVYVRMVQSPKFHFISFIYGLY